MENYGRDGNTRPPYLPPEKSVSPSEKGGGASRWFLNCSVGFLKKLQEKDLSPLISDAISAQAEWS